MSQDKPIYVTQPHLPPLEEFLPLLREIWEARILTNCGPFHQRLEKELAEHLGVEHIALFTNGTLALVTALQALRVTGEVITTPYSFVATSHSLLWNGLKPVFADVDPRTLNLDPARIEAAITPQTTAILPVHCYGHPCDVEAIQGIADAYNLKVIYDAAHAFGVRDGAGSVLRHGDLSVLSFHATKVFNTFEGGAIVCPDARTKARIDQLKNFGHMGEVTVVATGINGKMSEFNAALGLVQLGQMEGAIARRRAVDQAYRERLAGVKGIQCLGDAGETVANYAYFPVLVGPDFPISRDALYHRLKDHGIHPRRYFFPLISEFPMYRGLPSANPANLPVASLASSRILCLPIYPDLDLASVDRIAALVAGASMDVAVMQPYFFPYIGYFQLMSAADVFVLYDDVKYTKKGWINRNRILRDGKEALLSLPLAKAPDHLEIRRREVAATFDPRAMLRMLEAAYRGAPHFGPTFDLVERILLQDETNLFAFLHGSIRALAAHLGIRARILVSSEVPTAPGLRHQDRILALCAALGATRYVNAIGGTALYAPADFRDQGLDLRFIRSAPLVYDQGEGPFVPWLSIIDVLMRNPPDTVRAWVATAYELT